MIKNKINKRSLIRWKVYFDRSRMYIGYAQFALIIAVFFQSLGKNPITDFVYDNYMIAIPALAVLFVLCSLFIGYLDSKLGLREEEIRNFAQSNPVLMDLQKSMLEIKGQLSEIEAKIKTESEKSGK